MPGIATLDELERAIAEFQVTDLDLVLDPTALAAARQSLAESGFLLLGETHGVAENPLLIRALATALGTSGLALEWDEDLAPLVGDFVSGGPLRDHWLLWSGDGRITAGHLAVLREGSTAGWLRTLTLFDGTIAADWEWSQRDAAMAERVLAAPTAAGGTLVVAGNAHTPVRPHSLGIPLGARLAERRPGVREVSIRYGGGTIYNIRPRRLPPRPGGGQRIVLRAGEGEELVLLLPSATEALVPHRPRLAPGPPVEAGP